MYARLALVSPNVPVRSTIPLADCGTAMLARENFDDQHEEKGRTVEILHHNGSATATVRSCRMSRKTPICLSTSIPSGLIS